MIFSLLPVKGGIWTNRPWRVNHHLCWGLNSNCFPMVGDKDSGFLLKVG